MFTFTTRYADMTFEGIPKNGPSLRSQNGVIQTEDEEVAKALRKRRDVWEISKVPEMVEASHAETAQVPKHPGRPKGIRGVRTAVETQGE